MNNSIETFQFGDRVRVTSNSYACANQGDTGQIVDNGENGRYLVRWDYHPTILFGVHSCDIEKLNKRELS